MDVQVVNNRKGDFTVTLQRGTEWEHKLTFKADLTLQWNSQAYVVKAGKSRWVPEECLVPQFGYPGAVNTSKHKRRDEEVARLRVFYGIYDEEDAWQELLSKFKIEVLDHDGEHFDTPLSDPAGSNVKIVDDMDERDRLESVIAQMQRRLDQLEAQNAGPPATPDVPEGVDTSLSQPRVVGGGPDDTDLDTELDLDPLDEALDFEPPEDSPTLPAVDN